MKPKKMLISSGEPAGIGPDLIIQLAQEHHEFPLFVCGCPKLFQSRAQQLGLPLTLKTYDANQAPTKHQPGLVHIIPIATKTPVVAGQLNPSNAAYVLEVLHTAHKLVNSKEFSAIITAPVQKSIINEAGVHFSGHTEYFADQAGIKKVVMMLTADSLRVALATTHLPLKQVADKISAELLEEVLCILHQELKTKYKIAQPKILVCGLNPHAGEHGNLGDEEIKIIQPILDKLNQQGYNLEGPLPADTLFQPKYIDRADAILAMYHDQGLPVLKSHGFGKAVNITLGLPYIRTSVDHGTALPLAGTGQANANSMKHALKHAAELVNKEYE